MIKHPHLKRFLLGAVVPCFWISTILLGGHYWGVCGEMLGVWWPFVAALAYLVGLGITEIRRDSTR